MARTLKLEGGVELKEATVIGDAGVVQRQYTVRSARWMNDPVLAQDGMLFNAIEQATEAYLVELAEIKRHRI